ncbi:ATP-binding protein [Kitasatospora sp. NBC_01287]|uniref:ATP-binding protein n=1 Tax=Kitasatospora sp. NBC_01287 TaxID=2903573 RepID=UPI0022591542|nr:ATP-binding protein [Kitasatospora sp. NBC_01287]MCX4750267.1 ATP-binding protein [Kitasatospora sp. NBC_01287]
MPESIDSPPSPTDQDHCWLTRSPQAPARARRVLRAFLRTVRDGERFVGTGELLLSELVTNALVHGTRRGQLIRVGLEVDGELLWISVEDASGVPPQLRVTAEEESGRGLQLVDTLAEKWGWGPRDGIGVGKRVWCSCAPDPAVR